MDSPVIYIFYHLIISCRLNVRFNMQSCVHSFYYYFFLPHRPTHLRESEGDGKRNILLGWPKGHVNFASHNCLFTSSVLQGKGKNGEKQRQSASDASRIDPSYLSASRLVCNSLAFTPTAEPGHKLRGTQRQFLLLYTF